MISPAEQSELITRIHEAGGFQYAQSKDPHWPGTIFDICLTRAANADNELLEALGACIAGAMEEVEAVVTTPDAVLVAGYGARMAKKPLVVLERYDIGTGVRYRINDNGYDIVKKRPPLGYVAGVSATRQTVRLATSLTGTAGLIQAGVTCWRRGLDANQFWSDAVTFEHNEIYNGADLREFSLSFPLNPIIDRFVPLRLVPPKSAEDYLPEIAA